MALKVNTCAEAASGLFKHIFHTLQGNEHAAACIDAPYNVYVQYA
jgi:hypothetical protein